MTYDLTELQKKIHRIVEGNVDYPTSGDDDYELRTGDINDFISEWYKEEGVLWNELWKMASFASTSSTSYDLSATDNIDFIGGFVELVPSTGATTYWDVKKLEDVELIKDSQERFCYFTGDQNNGFTLNFNPNAYPGAGTIKFPYYKIPADLVNGTDKPEMSDPTYLVNMVASQLLAEDDPSGSDKHFTLGQNKLRAMKTRNAMTPPWMSDRLEDKRGVGFGR